MEVAPTRTMIVYEIMGRYSWAAWVILSTAVMVESVI